MKEKMKLFLKGMLMGVADLIPGISGGTIAFITGIYEEFISSIRQAVEAPLKAIRDRKLSPVKKVNYAFFVPLLSGLILSFIVALFYIEFFLQNFRAEIYSFFTALILASAIVIYRQITHKKLKYYLLALVGLLAGYVFTGMFLFVHEPSLLLIFFLGIVAVTAMLLPGVSGSFILLMFGQYEFMIASLKNPFEAWPFLLVFVFGGVVSLAALSEALSELFKRYKDPTLFFLTGLMLGSLNKPIMEVNTSLVSAQQVVISVALFVVAFLLVLLLDRKKKLV